MEMEPKILDAEMRVKMFICSNKGDIKTLEKMHAEGYPLTIHCGYIAAANNDFNTLLWLHKHGCTMNTFTAVANIRQYPLSSVGGKSTTLRMEVDEQYFVKMMYSGQKMTHKPDVYIPVLPMMTQKSHEDYDCRILDWFTTISFQFNVSLLIGHAKRTNNVVATDWLARLASDGDNIM